MGRIRKEGEDKLGGGGKIGGGGGGKVKVN